VGLPAGHDYLAKGLSGAMCYRSSFGVDYLLIAVRRPDIYQSRSRRLRLALCVDLDYGEQGYYLYGRKRWKRYNKH